MQREVSFANVTLAAAALPPLRVAKRLRRLALPVCERLLSQRPQYYEIAAKVRLASAGGDTDERLLAFAGFMPAADSSAPPRCGC